MEIEKKLELIVKAINETEDFNGEDFNKTKVALNTYEFLYGKEELKKVLASKTDLEYNKFYYLDSEFKQLVFNNSFSIEKANQYTEKIENRYTRDWIKIDLIRKAIDNNQTEIAENIIHSLPDEDSGPSQYVGHRLMLKYFAKNGDLNNFKKRTKPSKPSKFPRGEVGNMKSILIEGYSKKQGYKKGLELLKNKYFEKVSSISTIRWNAKNLSIRKIDLILSQNPQIEEDTPYAKSDLYVLHFRENPITESIPSKTFEKVIEEILKIDKDEKCGDGRYRDFLFMDLGSSTRDLKQIKQCKSLIISPRIKKELNYHISNISE